jgi:hypothetical protein
VRCSGCQAHHLIPGGMGDAAAARAILQGHYIDINSPVNGVWLKGRNSPDEWAGAIHNGPHFRDYARIVNDRIVAANNRGGKQAVLDELNLIRDELFEEGGQLAALL